MSLLAFILDLWLASGPPVFLVPGSNWTTNVPQPPPREWWAVCGERVMKATVRFRPEGEQTEVSVDGCESSQLIVRGLEGMAERNALPGKISERRVEVAGRTLELSVKKGRLELRDGARSQILSRKAESVGVEWAGDLDGDGEPDLLLFIELQGQDGGGENVLFVSRGRRPGKLVRRAARQEQSPC